MRTHSLAGIFWSVGLGLLVVCLSSIGVANESGKYASNYAWSRSPSEPRRLEVGKNTIMLVPCPKGLMVANLSGIKDGVQPHEYVHIAGAGASEAVRIDSGIGHGGDASCTINVTTTQAHAEGYTVGTATGGIKEASEDAMFLSETSLKSGVRSKSGGKVILDPAGSPYRVYASAYIEATDQIVSGAGGVIDCYLKNDHCVAVGDDKSTHYTNIQLEHLRFHPSVQLNTGSALYVNAQGTKVRDITTIPAGNGSFGHIVTVCDDQAFTLDGLEHATWALRDDAAFVGSVVYSPGPFNKCSAVGWLKHLNISPQCVGNGVDWQSGNTLHISDSVIQGYAQYGIRGGIARGGYGNIKLDNVYMEVGNCSNPIPGLGIAGVIAQGGRWQIDGGEGPQGKVGRFASTGTTRYEYFIVARDASHASAPLYIGYALTNRSGNITVTSPDIQTQTPVSSYDLLRTTWIEGPPYTVTPWGTGNWAVVTKVARARACTGGVCTFIDTNAPLQSYTVSDPPTFSPILSAWSGDIVLSYGSTLSLHNTKGIGAYDIVSTNGSAGVSVVSDNCGLTQLWQPLWVACPPAMHEGNFLGPGPGNAPNYYNLKGRLNFGNPKGVPSHVITLRDSNPSKTIAWANNRPPSDANDAYIGYDSGIGDYIGISFGAPGSISNYIGSAGDGKNWKERLTAKQKIFSVPVAIKSGNTFTLGPGSALSEIKIYTTNAIPRTIVPAQSCFDVIGTADGLGTADQITGITPPSPLGNVSLNAYPRGANAVTLHFCNPSTSNVNVPSGAYSFLAVR